LLFELVQLLPVAVPFFFQLMHLNLEVQYQLLIIIILVQIGTLNLFKFALKFFDGEVFDSALLE
jgi:hypothetical protein